VLAAMVVTMTRVNGIYERDMSLRMNLIANNDAIIFVTSDNFDNNNANVLINQSQTVIDAAVGAANYDIGHTVSTGGGGLAQLNSPCSSNKARGITGSRAPVGDP
ncbi:MAG TPA: zinc-dependent metalloprotease family protein, partial [Flavobacterium sp.]|nr:zinc-dependent metalloprotease family protein [Flavobacterium sp.]